MNSEVHRRPDAACLKVILLPPETLKPTEETVPARLREVSDSLLATGIWHTPILVERSSLVVMDGHHRHAFALAHGFARVPCLLLSYSDVRLESRHKDQLVTPAEVITRGLEGRLYPAKSTRHIAQPWAETTCSYSLEELRMT
ncbi:hypothetical protein BWP39_23725 [Paraburkholderia acidicola]|uniref:Uncharacterized protein n=1 Tax=Paraburkholderia acidicola TaxID=1912599 RepID=A0A2A4EQJ6_9BURK|nr:hypothetical protein BWP39_23725 [Paraburkholderia acidicola]